MTLKSKILLNPTEALGPWTGPKGWANIHDLRVVRRRMYRMVKCYRIRGEYAVSRILGPSVGKIR